MEQLTSYADDRLVASCIYCGAGIETRDHCPSHILLDQPYPEYLPVVPSCASCNRGFSLDEEYFACLVECVKAGSIEAVQRPKIRATLNHSPALAVRLTQARSIDPNGTPSFDIEQDRVKNIVLKLARGHAAFELSELPYTEPSTIMFEPLHLLTTEARHHFETPPSVVLWPEVGSRAMQRILIADNMAFGPGWIDVQPGQYRYLTVTGKAILIRFVVGEYLACEVIWDDEPDKGDGYPAILD